MPGIYKIGCTSKSPRARAEELSSPTGVPNIFEVVCYIDVPEFQLAESRIHKKLSHLRANTQREFFIADADLLSLRAVCFYPDRDCTFYHSYEFACALDKAGVVNLWSLPDPWEGGY